MKKTENILVAIIENMWENLDPIEAGLNEMIKRFEFTKSRFQTL